MEVVAILLQGAAPHGSDRCSNEFHGAGGICTKARYIPLPRHGVCLFPSPVECDDSRRTRNLARGELDNRATATEDKG